jgi:hypothetical protein
MRWKRFVDWSWCENIAALIISAGICVLAYRSIESWLFLSVASKTLTIAFCVWLPLRFIDLLVYGPQRRERERTKADLMQNVMYRRD